jgi:uncharacterized protein YdcH (DUF465 family)
MSIYSALDEYEKLDSEIQRIRDRIRTLVNRQNALKDTILTYLDDNNKPGIKNPRTGFIIRRKQVVRTKPKKKTQRRHDCLSVMKSYGIRNSDEIYEALEKARSGERYTDYRLT